MTAPADNQRPLKQLQVLETGSALWNSLHIVTSQLARQDLPKTVDLNACREVLALAEAIEAKNKTSADMAEIAVDLILCSYQRAQFRDAASLARELGLQLMKRAPGLVAMMVDPDHGVSSLERHPPTQAVLTDFLNRTSERLKQAGWKVRRVLALKTGR